MSPLQGVCDHLIATPPRRCGVARTKTHGRHRRIRSTLNSGAIPRRDSTGVRTTSRIARRVAPVGALHSSAWSGERTTAWATAQEATIRAQERGAAPMDSLGFFKTVILKHPCESDYDIYRPHFLMNSPRAS